VFFFFFYVKDIDDHPHVFLSGDMVPLLKGFYATIG